MLITLLNPLKIRKFIIEKNHFYGDFEFFEKLEISYNKKFIFNLMEYAEQDSIVPLGTECG